MNTETRRDEQPGQRAIDFLAGVPNPKSALRIQYEAETKVFRDQHGGLEDIRRKLGFSRRKMCQLLLVDPSAWTRWMKDETKVPPHIFRSLEWFLALNEKVLTQPDLAKIFQSRFQLGTTESWREDLEAVKKDLRLQRQVSAFLMAGLLMILIISSWLVYKS